MACASSCKSGDHATYGECLRAKRIATAAGETTRPSFPPKEPKQ